MKIEVSKFLVKTMRTDKNLLHKAIIYYNDAQNKFTLTAPAVPDLVECEPWLARLGYQSSKMHGFLKQLDATYTLFANPETQVLPLGEAFLVFFCEANASQYVKHPKYS